ncbi:MAG: hypothetical protein DRQ97_00750 [Gammaproteobacteria bacterium]|nr:MAG: hypothetical protein DRQ97_00750 [Gammaproteobacteria bacterium]
MPTISQFFGILIRMYYDDHNPPRFHVIYGEYEATIEIATLEIIKGELPKRALALTVEWAVIHRNELRHDWDLAVLHKPLDKIEPLE